MSKRVPRWSGTGGEIEARNTQARQHMSELERQATPLEFTADNAVDQAIVLPQAAAVQEDAGHPSSTVKRVSC